MPYMEVTSLQCRWVCSLQLLATWEKESQHTHIWWSLLAWTSPLCWMDVCPQRPFWLPPSRQICRMPTRSRVPTKVGLMMTKSEAEDKGPSEDYTFFGVDLKPVLPVCLAVSNCDWWPVHAPGADSDVVAFHRSIAGVALCTFCGGLWHCVGVHGVVIVPVLILGKSTRRARWKLVLLVAWTSRRGCCGVRTSRGNIPVLSAAMIILVNGWKMSSVFSEDRWHFWAIYNSEHSGG